MSMISVRFPADLAARARRLAQQDGVTLSRWVRRLVEREMKPARRPDSVDVRLYPQSVTCASGATRVEWLDAAPGNVTR